MDGESLHEGFGGMHRKRHAIVSACLLALLAACSAPPREIPPEAFARVASPELFLNIHDQGELERDWARWFASQAESVEPPRGSHVGRWLEGASPDGPLLLIETVQAGSWLPIRYEAVALRSADDRPADEPKLHPLIFSDRPLVYTTPAAWDVVVRKTREIVATPPTEAFGYSTNRSLIFLSFWDGRTWSTHVRHFPVRYVAWFDELNDYPADTVEWLRNHPHADDEAYADSLRERPLFELILFLRSHAQIRRHLPGLSSDFDWRISPLDRFEVETGPSRVGDEPQPPPSVFGSGPTPE